MYVFRLEYFITFLVIKSTLLIITSCNESKLLMAVLAHVEALVVTSD